MPSLTDPSAEYAKRLEQRRRWLVESHRETHMVATLRLVAEILFLVAAYFAFALHRFSGWLILVPAAAYIAFVIYSQRVYPLEKRALRAVRF